MDKELGNVLVTGGAGFIGSAISDLLAPRASRFVAVDNLHPQVHSNGGRPARLHPSAELIVADVTDPLAWDQLLADFRPSTVIHLAAETGTAQSLSEATRHAHVNVVGTTVMLDAFTRSGHTPDQFVLSSSRAVYGEGEWISVSGAVSRPGPRSHAKLKSGDWGFGGLLPQKSQSSRTAPSPTSIYGATKLAQENILRAWVSSHDSNLTVLRLQNVYGPGQSLVNSYTGIVSLFSQIAGQSASIPIYEDGLIIRDFVFIDDVAEAFALAVDRLPESGYRTLDIGSGDRTSILDIASMIATHHDAPAPHVTGAFREGDVRHSECDISDALHELGWEPRWTLGRGISELQDWIASEKSQSHPATLTSADLSSVAASL